MRKILIASHGRVASGVKSAVGILLGDGSMMEAVDCYLDEEDFSPRIEKFIQSVKPEDEAVIFTDLVGGSVCNKVMTLRPEEHGVIHVSGFNLIAVLGCCLSDEPLTEAVVDEILSTASVQMKRVVVEPDIPTADDDDFFS